MNGQLLLCALILRIASANPIRLGEENLKPVTSRPKLPEKYIAQHDFFHLPKGEFITNDWRRCRVKAFDGALWKRSGGVLPISSLRSHVIEGGQSIYTPFDGEVQVLEGCYFRVSPGVTKRKPVNKELPNEPIAKREETPLEAMISKARREKPLDLSDVGYTVMWSVMAFIVFGTFLSVIVGFVACSICSCMLKYRPSPEEDAYS